MLWWFKSGGVRVVVVTIGSVCDGVNNVVYGVSGRIIGGVCGIIVGGVNEVVVTLMVILVGFI